MKILLLLSIVGWLTLGQESGTESSSVGRFEFQMAKEFYARTAESEPWPEDRLTGSEYLGAAASLEYLDALYSLFIGYEYGFLGEIDPIKAESYRDRWLASKRSPATYYQFALREFDIHSKEKVPNESGAFIFTGASAKRNFAAAQASARHYGGTRRVDGSEAKAVLYLVEAASIGIHTLWDRAPEDEFAMREAIKLLVQLGTDEEVKIAMNRAKAVAAASALKVKIVQTLLLARRANVLLPAKSLNVVQKLLQSMNEREFLGVFQPDHD